MSHVTRNQCGTHHQLLHRYSPSRISRCTSTHSSQQSVHHLSESRTPSQPPDPTLRQHFPPEPPVSIPPSTNLVPESLSNDDFCSHPARPTSLPLLTSPNGSPLPSPDHPMTQVAPELCISFPAECTIPTDYLVTTTEPSTVVPPITTDATLPVTHGEQLQEFHKHWSVVFSANLLWLE